MKSSSKNLLLVDDDTHFRETLAVEFSERGYNILSAEGLHSFVQLDLARKQLDFAIVDLRLKAELGLNALCAIKEVQPQCRVVMLTGYPTVTTAVQAMKLGAANYLLKPVGIETLEHALWLDGIDASFDLSSSDLKIPSLARHEYEYIEFVLAQCNFNITQTAQRLGLHRQSLQRKLKKYPPRQ